MQTDPANRDAPGTLQQRLGYAFRDVSLLRLALTHSSVSQESTQPAAHNQRLEFLGDAVLQLALTLELFTRFPELDEGPLTKARSRLVNQSSLAERGRLIGLGDCLILSRAEEVNGGRTRASILADALEAVIGAVFLDGGYDPARDVVVGLFGDRLDLVEELASAGNPKGELQEMLQARTQQSPEYTLVSATGPDHDREFECAVWHQGVELARGRGRSKKLAEGEAARNALRALHQPGTDEPQAS